MNSKTRDDRNSGSRNCYRFSGDVSVPFWDAINAAEPEAGTLYEHGCLAQRLESAFIAAKAFVECHAADPDITDEMCRAYAEYKSAVAEFER
tara:strand:- start:53 stop:328 length:276 start_codon:yes stop_codon:yes gene_type:complete